MISATGKNKAVKELWCLVERWNFRSVAREHSREGDYQWRFGSNTFWANRCKGSKAGRQQEGHRGGGEGTRPSVDEGRSWQEGWNQTVEDSWGHSKNFGFYPEMGGDWRILKEWHYLISLLTVSFCWFFEQTFGRVTTEADPLVKKRILGWSRPEWWWLGWQL